MTEITILIQLPIRYFISEYSYQQLQLQMEPIFPVHNAKWNLIWMEMDSVLLDS